MRNITTKESFHTYRDILRKPEVFATRGALRGVRVSSETHTLSDLPTGRMSDKHVQLFRAWGRQLSASGAAGYVVYSYDTPIAWGFNGSWVMPNEKYSITTSSHQNKIQAALQLS